MAIRKIHEETIKTEDIHHIGLTVEVIGSYTYLTGEHIPDGTLLPRGCKFRVSLTRKGPDEFLYGIMAWGDRIKPDATVDMETHSAMPLMLAPVLSGMIKRLRTDSSLTLAQQTVLAKEIAAIMPAAAMTIWSDALRLAHEMLPNAPPVLKSVLTDAIWEQWGVENNLPATEVTSDDAKKGEE